MKIAVGGIEHESSNFTPVETPLSMFQRELHYFEGSQLSARAGDTNTIVDGFLTGLREHNQQIAPLLWAKAPSGGQPTLETHEYLKNRLLDRLRDQLPVDGVLLSLHGAYSVQGVDDGDGDITKAVRELIGPELPLITVHDLHSNIGPDMVDNATALIVEDTYPHTDMAERGYEAADMIVRTVAGKLRPTLGWCSIPIFWNAARMVTAESPMADAMEQVFAMEREPDVLSASLSVGYQWADVPVAGASTLVVTHDDPVGAQRKANDLGRWVWNHRNDWLCQSLSASEGLTEGQRLGKYPIILADQADNPGGGAPSDSTEILRLFLDHDLQDAAVLYIVDRESVQRAQQTGVGNVGDFQVGGKSHELVGPPVALTAEVLALTDGHFVYDGPMFKNLETSLGDSALIRQGGVHVVLISVPNQPIDLAFARTLGLDCTKMQYLGLKSTVHFRSGFGPIAGSIFNVDTTSLMTQNFSKLPFQRLGRKIFPIDADVEFQLEED